MHKQTLYRYILPYCIRAINEPQTWILLNREYKPLGNFDTETYVDYDKEPSRFKIIKPYHEVVYYLKTHSLIQHNPPVPQFHLYEEHTDPFVPFLTTVDNVIPNPYPDFIKTGRWIKYSFKLAAIMRLNVTLQTNA